MRGYVQFNKYKHTHTTVESPYVLVVNRKCISLYQLQYCNIACVLELVYYLECTKIFLICFLSGVPAWRLMEV